MRRLMIAVSAVALSGLIGGAALQAAEPVKSVVTELMTTPLTGDATREVKILNVLQPPGADSGPHRHPGDQYTTVQEGSIEITVEGSGKHVLKAGDVLHIDPMVVHRTQNLSDKPARTTELFIVVKGKPLSEKVE